MTEGCNPRKADVPSTNVFVCSERHIASQHDMKQNSCKSLMQNMFKLNIALLKAQRIRVSSFLTKVTSKFSFRISTKRQLKNLDQTPSLNPDLNSASKSRQSLSFKILTKLSSTHSSLPTPAVLTTSRSSELASSKARVTPVKSRRHLLIS